VLEAVGVLLGQVRALLLLAALAPLAQHLLRGLRHVLRLRRRLYHAVLLQRPSVTLLPVLESASLVGGDIRETLVRGVVAIGDAGVGIGGGGLVA